MENLRTLRRMQEKKPAHYPKPAPVRLDYSDTYFSNDNLNSNLGEEMEAMDKTIYKTNLKKDEEYKRAQEESEQMIALKEAIEEKKKKGSKLDLGRNYDTENKVMYGEYWGGVDEEQNDERPSSSNKQPLRQIRPVTTVGRALSPGQKKTNTARPKTTLGQISNVIAATSRFRRAAERFNEREPTPEKTKVRRTKSAFYTGLDDSDDDEKPKTMKNKKTKKLYGIKHSMHRKAHERSRRELEELVRLEALKKEKKMTHADVREQRLQELKEEGIKLRYKIDKFLAGIERYKVNGIIVSRLEHTRPQTAYRF